MELQRRLLFIGLAAGVFISFQLMAIAQEKVFKTEYNGEKFKFPVSFVALQILSFAIFGGGELKIIK